MSIPTPDEEIDALHPDITGLATTIHERIVARDLEIGRTILAALSSPDSLELLRALAEDLGATGTKPPP